MTFAKTTDSATLHLAELPFSMRPFYLVQQTSQDVRFPINLNYGYLLPKNYLIAEETYNEAGATHHYRLEAMSAATHFLDISSYEEIN